VTLSGFFYVTVAAAERARGRRTRPTCFHLQRRSIGCQAKPTLKRIAFHRRVIKRVFARNAVQRFLAFTRAVVSSFQPGASTVFSKRDPTLTFALPAAQLGTGSSRTFLDSRDCPVEPGRFKLRHYPRAPLLDDCAPPCLYAGVREAASAKRKRARAYDQ
jgi:hypothetical protein